jgi:hypothetical protein
MLRFPLVLLATTLPAAAALWAASAAAVLIDDFTTPQSLSGRDQGAVDGGGILGGQREVIVETFFEAMEGSATLGGPPGTLAAALIYDGSGDPGSPGVVDLFLGSADLTDGGLSDRFLLEITDISGVFDVFITVIEDESNASRSSFSAPVSITTTGTVEIAFSDLTLISGAGADFASAEALVIAFDSSGDGSDDFLTIADISTVPEPGTVGQVVCLACVAGLRMLRRTMSRQPGQQLPRRILRY